jgi:hypothetical protein
VFRRNRSGGGDQLDEDPDQDEQQVDLDQDEQPVARGRTGASGKGRYKRARELAAAGTTNQPDDADDDGEFDEQDAVDDGPAARSKPVRRGRTSTRGPTPVYEDDGRPPSAMRGNEPFYGFIVNMLLLATSVLDLVDTTGKGAPAHPDRVEQIAGVVAGLVLLGLQRTKHRFIVGFATIIAVFFITLPKAPDSLVLPHLVCLAAGFAYGMWITLHQSRAIKAKAVADKAASRTQTRLTPAERKAQALAQRQEKRNKRRGVATTGPKPSSRYTPPKAKRRRPT